MERRLHLFYSGNVQGVGFRFTVLRAARELGLTGWVRNMRDGRVEVLCEGDEERLKDFRLRISEYMKDYIRKTDDKWSEPTGEFRGFNIV